MLTEIDSFYLQKQEPEKSCLLALRQFILDYNKEITETWKYRMPVFCYKGKMFCYLWLDKKVRPYLGIVEERKIDHPSLIADERSRMKIMIIDPQKDLPVKTINTIFRKALLLYN